MFWQMAQGYDLARVAALKFLEGFKQDVQPDDREVCFAIAFLPHPCHMANMLLPGTSVVSCKVVADQIRLLEEGIDLQTNGLVD